MIPCILLPCPKHTHTQDVDECMIWIEDHEYIDFGFINSENMHMFIGEYTCEKYQSQTGYTVSSTTSVTYCGKNAKVFPHTMHCNITPSTLVSLVLPQTLPMHPEDPTATLTFYCTSRLIPLAELFLMQKTVVDTNTLAFLLFFLSSVLHAVRHIVLHFVMVIKNQC